MGNNYHVNLNELLDNDEHFLFKNKAFRNIISNVHNFHGHLVNVNFDISEMVEEKANKKGKLKSINIVEDDKPFQLELGMQARTFNTGKMTTNPFQKMLIKYDSFFSEQKLQMDARI